MSLEQRTALIFFETATDGTVIWWEEKYSFAHYEKHCHLLRNRSKTLSAPEKSTQAAAKCYINSHARKCIFLATTIKYFGQVVRSKQLLTLNNTAKLSREFQDKIKRRKPDLPMVWAISSDDSRPVLCGLRCLCKIIYERSNLLCPFD